MLGDRGFFLDLPDHLRTKHFEKEGQSALVKTEDFILKCQYCQQPVLENSKTPLHYEKSSTMYCYCCSKIIVAHEGFRRCEKDCHVDYCEKCYRKKSLENYYPKLKEKLEELLT